MREVLLVIFLLKMVIEWWLVMFFCIWMICFWFWNWLLLKVSFLNFLFVVCGWRLNVMMLRVFFLLMILWKVFVKMCNLLSFWKVKSVFFMCVKMCLNRKLCSLKNKFFRCLIKFKVCNFNWVFLKNKRFLLWKNFLIFKFFLIKV